MAEIGFPAELNAKLDYTTPAEVSSMDVRLFPTNIASVQSATIAAGGATGLLDIPLPTSTFTFSLPTGAKGQFLDHRFTRLNYRVNYEVVSATSGATAPTIVSTLRSGAHAYIQRLFSESQSGVVVSDQPQYDVIADMYNQFAYDVAQRDANAMALGFESTRGSGATASINSNTGHTITPWTTTNAHTSAGNNFYSYSIPILDPLIGEWARRFFAVGQVNRHSVNIQLPSLAPITFLVNTAATTAGSVRITIDQVSLSVRIISLPLDALRMVGKDKGLQYYNGVVGRVATQSLGTTAGSQSWLIGIRGSSVKNLITRFSEGVFTTAGCVNRQFDSKMPLYQQIGYNVNGVNLPASPDSLVNSPAQAFARTQMAMAQFNSYDFKSGIVPAQYAVFTPTGSVPADLDEYSIEAGSASTATALCSFHYGINLERISKAGILSGMNLNSGSVYLNVNSGAVAPTNALVAYFVSLLDSLIIHDVDSGELSVRL